MRGLLFAGIMCVGVGGLAFGAGEATFDTAPLRDEVPNVVSSSLPGVSVSTGGGIVTFVGNVTYNGISVGDDSVVAHYSDVNGTVTLNASSAPRPQLTMSCSDDTCTVNAYDGDGVGANPEEAMAHTKALLEKIAQRGVTMDITVIGHTCQKHHEVIEPAKPDLVAARD